MCVAAISGLLAQILTCTDITSAETLDRGAVLPLHLPRPRPLPLRLPPPQAATYVPAKTMLAA